MKTITMDQLFDVRESLGKDEIILDVRGPGEFAEGHIQGSINISHEEVGRHLDELKKYKTIYIHCRSGKRAQMAADALITAGITNLVCINSGGMMDWVAAGYPVEK